MSLRLWLCLLLLTVCSGASASETITGRIFDDANGNGVYDASETLLAGWTVYIDVNENGVLDAGEPSTVTDVNGNYTFTDVSAGLTAKEYRVAIVPPAGWAVINPSYPLKKLGSYSTYSYQYGDVWGEGNVGIIGGYVSSAPITLLDISDLTNPKPFATWADQLPDGFVFPEPNLTHPNCNGGCGCGCNPVQWTAAASSTGNQYEYVILKNSIAYIGSNAGLGFSVVDCHNPAAPTTLTRIGAAQGGSDYVHTMFLDGNHLYVADNRTTTVWVFDVSNPATPVPIRTIVAHADPNGKRVHQINVKNGRLFVAVNTLLTEKQVAAPAQILNSEVWDVSDVANSATYLGSWDSDYCTHTVNVTDDGKYGISAREPYPWEGAVGDVTIWDISNPSAPFKVSTLNAGPLGFGDCTAHIPVVRGNLLFVSWYWAGLKVFDITDPTHPALVGHFHTSNMSTEFTGNWGVYPIPNTSTILASDMENGLITLTPSAPNGHYTDLAITPTVQLDFAVRPPPAITSASATPSTVFAGDPVTFTAAASSEDPIPLTYSWNFGDTALGTGSLTSHTYTTAGIFTVTLTIKDSKGGIVTTTLHVTVNNNPIPTVAAIAPQSATAGDPDFTLTVTGTNYVHDSVVNWNGTPHTTTFTSSATLTAVIRAADVATAGTANVSVVTPAPGGGISGAALFTINTPTGTGPGTGPGIGGGGGDGGTTPAAPLPMTVSKISGSMKYSSGGADSVTLQGSVTSLPDPFDPTGKLVLLNISGASAQFTLDGKGKASNANGTFQLLLKPIKSKSAMHVFSGGNVSFKAKLQHGSFADLWASAGVNKKSSQKGAKLSLIVSLTIDGVAYSGTANATITSKANSGGRFK